MTTGPNPDQEKPLVRVGAMTQATVGSISLLGILRSTQWNAGDELADEEATIRRRFARGSQCCGHVATPGDLLATFARAPLLHGDRNQIKPLSSTTIRLRVHHSWCKR
jgi:hypothetical protein